MRTPISLICILIAPSFTNAVELSYQFSGTLTSVTDQYGLLAGQFPVGSTMNGVVTYETSTPEGSTTVGDPTVGIYAAVLRFRLSVNGFTFEGSQQSLPGFVQVWDDRVVHPSIVDAVTFSSPLDYTPPISGMGPGTVVGGANLNLFDFRHTASKYGKTIPTTIHLADFGSAVFSALQLNIDTKQAFHLDGTVSTLTAVPEPSGQVLLLFGVPIVLALRSVRKEA